MNSTLILTFGTTCLLSIFVCWAARSLARRVGLIDRPDGHRKLHQRAVPVTGGIAVFTTMVLMIAGLMAIDEKWRTMVLEHRELDQALGLLAGSVIILIVGILDDRFKLRGRQKLLGQFAAAAVIVSFGVCIRKISFLGFEPWDLGILAVPFTIFWLLGAVNALNLLDGIDGLVATLGVILSTAIAVMAFHADHPALALIACVLAGSLVGFLRFNLPPASMYLGDAGSMLIGLIVGVLAIQASLKGPGTVLLASPLALWTIPIFDSFAAILRRKLTGRSIYTTDRAHLHHHLVQRIGHGWTLVCLAGVAAVTSCAALLAVWWNLDLIALLCAGSVICAFVGLRVFGHSELLLALVRGRSFLRSMISPKRRKAREAVTDAVRLQGTRQWELLWETLTEWAVKLELVHLRLDVNVPRLGEGYHASWNRPYDDEQNRHWRLELPLIADHRVMGYLKVVGEREGVAGQNLEQLLDLMEQIESHLLSIVTADAEPSTTARRSPVPVPQPDLATGLARPTLDPELRATTG